MSLTSIVNAKAIELGKEVLRMTTAAGSGHPTSALSIMHLTVTLMYDRMRWDPADPWNPACDRLVLSEGHAVPAVYAAYADLGGVVGPNRSQCRPLALDDLSSLREVDSVLDGHPNPSEGFPFFDAATGSLGQGLSVGAGLALGARQRGIDRRIYVLIGDGESREGQIWEALDFIADHKLTNVVSIFNCNGQGQADYVSGQQSAESLAAKTQSFGCRSVVIDGHDADAIIAALGDPAARDRPLALIARTRKGWGCPSMQNRSNHGKPVAPDKLDSAIAELDEMVDRLGVGGVERDLKPSPPVAAEPLSPTPIATSDFATAITDAGMEGALAKGKLSTRRAYGAALLALAKADKRVLALDGDVSNSTFSDILAKRMPERFFECKIAEQNMISAAVGLAASGFIPFASTFAKFVARAYDQIEMAQITRANVKIVGSHAGISLAADGPSQMSLHDVSYFRTATGVDSGVGHPACVTFHPCDAVAAFHCTVLMANYHGMCYMRTHRPDVPLIYSPETAFEIGGSHVLNEGGDVTIVSAGYMIHVCKEAISALAADGIQCALIDAYSFPLNAAPILDKASQSGGRVLCVEDNYGGGLGGAVAEAAAESGGVRVESMTCRRIPKSAKTPDAIMSYMGLGASDIADRAKQFVG
ncbi:MAG: transketolase [Planctomycetota bacterium]|nr:transketolase [Planctomycetota bacterium]